MENQLTGIQPDIGLMRSPWAETLADLISVSEDFLLIASPFITRSASEWIGERLNARRASVQPQILCLTNLRVESVLNGALELDGLVKLGRSFAKFAAIHLPALHAKVFVADDRHAIVTSGNLTTGGLHRNCEYGVSIRRSDLVREVRADFEGYARLGAPLSIDEIENFAVELEGLRDEYRAVERRTVRAAGAILRRKLQNAEDRVLRLRARTSNQAIFCETIEYLLSKEPLPTTELQPLIQHLHPDLCNDSIDRVIDGVNFGKKWKHLVRTAQQALKRQGRIAFDGSRWFLTGNSSDRGH